MKPCIYPREDEVTILKSTNRVFWVSEVKLVSEVDSWELGLQLSAQRNVPW